MIKNLHSYQSCNGTLYLLLTWDCFKMEGGVVKNRMINKSFKPNQILCTMNKFVNIIYHFRKTCGFKSMDNAVELNLKWPPQKKKKKKKKSVLFYSCTSDSTIMRLLLSNASLVIKYLLQFFSFTIQNNLWVAVAGFSNAYTIKAPVNI